MKVSTDFKQIFKESRNLNLPLVPLCAAAAITAEQK